MEHLTWTNMQFFENKKNIETKFLIMLYCYYYYIIWKQWWRAWAWIPVGTGQIPGLPHASFVTVDKVFHL